MKTLFRLLFAILMFGLTSCAKPGSFDVLIQNGYVLDGTGGQGTVADIGINADTIAAIGDLEGARGKQVIDASGLTVAPGFINMLSWANVSLIEDGRSQSDIRQGVTLEVLGEGRSMGPLNEKMAREMEEDQGSIQYDVNWRTLGEYMNYMQEKGISANIASFVGNGTVREYVMGYENRVPAPDELARMEALVQEAMEEGAVGLSTSLIYVPSGHAQTEEIIALARVVAKNRGMYISHIRDEEGKLLEAVDELITIAEEAGLPAEIYHFKASGTANWHLLDSAISRVEKARNRGLPITTDMYMYNASSTGLNVLLPAWAKEGGHNSTIALMKDPAMRKKMIQEVDFHVPPENILLVGFKNKDLRHLIGRTLAEVAAEREKPANEAVADLIFEDDSRIQVVYFSMSEDNIRKKLALPYMAICSDAGSYTNEGVFLEQSTHPRAYGSFARLLGHYVREEKVIPLEEAIHRLTLLPATNLKLDRRGALRTGYFADIAIFDADEITDHATFSEPHQYASGMIHVLVNGVPVMKDGEHTGAFPGRFVKGPGYKGKNRGEMAHK